VLCEVADIDIRLLANLPQPNLKTKEQYLFISRHFAKHIVMRSGGAKKRSYDL
jgi:hypothetical protein